MAVLFIHQPDQVAQKTFFHMCCYMAFLRAGNPCMAWCLLNCNVFEKGYMYISLELKWVCGHLLNIASKLYFLSKIATSGFFTKIFGNSKYGQIC